MAKLITLEMTKTYATRENAIKAVEKKFPASDSDNLRYMTLQHTDGRWYPVFIGQQALQAGVHFHFHVVA